MTGSSRPPAWRGYAGLSLVWLAILAVVLLATRRPAAQPIEILPPPTPLPAPSPLPTATLGPLHVDVAGAVRSPGVYTLAPGSIVADAIAAAGGPAPDADPDQLNKAVPLQDAMQVYVPRRPDRETPAVVRPTLVTPLAPVTTGGTPLAAPLGAAPSVQEQAKRVNINTATLEELDGLPGVGPAIGQSIIDGRPYGAIEDLLRVQGIGEARLAKLKDLVTVR